MSNEFRGLPHHSADSLGDTREHWWNRDFIALHARRWRLEHARSVLDVGCGVGHWARVIASVLPPAARIVGVDREPAWVVAAHARAQADGSSARMTFQVGAAEKLPFPASTFDVVTCQTLLMHVADAEAVVTEMVRVTRPGGLLLVAEPTNIAGGLLEATAIGDPPDTATALLGFELTCARGKAVSGEGNSLIGESLPRLLVAAGLANMEIRNTDRVWSLTPPYDTADARAEIEERTDNVARGRWIWDEGTTSRYFCAGGGDARDFPVLWQAALARQRRVLDAIQAGTYHCAGGSLFYLAWGFKAPGLELGARGAPGAI